MNLFQTALGFSLGFQKKVQLLLSCDSFPLGGTLQFDNIKVTMTSKQLNGSQRVLLDGVISDDECRELHRLSNVSYHKIKE